MDKAQGYSLIESYSKEYKRANLKIENLNFEIANKDKEILFLKTKISKTIFQSTLLFVGWTLYTGIKTTVFKK
jgi:hypothetical protein